MAKDSQRLEQEFIASAKEKTGKSVQEWLPIIQASGQTKSNAIIKWLKDEHALNHMQATFLMGMFLNDGKPVYDYDVLFAKLFDGKAALRPVYDSLQQKVSAILPDAEFVPTKTYVSIEGKKCFACATLTKNTIRVGVDLGAMPFGDYVQKAKSLGAMPNITHMIEISAVSEVNDQLVGYVEQAYHQVHS